MKKKIIISLTLLLFVISSCKNKSNSNTETTSDTTTTISNNNENNNVIKIGELEKLPENFYKHYSGTIGDIKIKFSINKSGENLSGYYFYKNIKQNIYLSGTVDDNNDIEIHEYIGSSKETGIFTGKMNKDKIIGTWKGGNKEFDFVLQEDYSESLRFENYQRKEVYKMYGIDSFPEFEIELSTIYPVDEKGNTLDKINDIILNFNFEEDIEENTPTETFDNYIKYRINDYKEVCEEEKNPDYDLIMEDSYIYSWTYSDNWSIGLNDNNRLSLSFQSDEYSGGAHGYYAISSLNIDTKKGEIISIDDIFDEENKEEVRQIILKKIEEEGRAEELFTPDDVGVTENFYLDISGIGFVYNPYEIGPYSSGLFDIYIDFSEIKNLVKPTFKLK